MNDTGIQLKMMTLKNTNEMSNVKVYISMLLMAFTAGCADVSGEGYIFYRPDPMASGTFSEKSTIIITGENNYIVNDDPEDVFSHETMDHSRLIRAFNTISNGFHTCFLEEDKSTSTVRYVSGFHFSDDEEVQISTNPLQGKTLHSEYKSDEWSDYYLLDENISDEIRTALANFNHNESLGKNAQPTSKIRLGESWSATKLVTNQVDNTESIYSSNTTFDRELTYKGMHCAKLKFESTLQTKNNQTSVKINGYSYYSFEYGMDIEVFGNGTIISKTYKWVGTNKFTRISSGNMKTHVVLTEINDARNNGDARDSTPVWKKGPKKE